MNVDILASFSNGILSSLEDAKGRAIIEVPTDGLVTTTKNLKDTPESMRSFADALWFFADSAKGSFRLNRVFRQALQDIESPHTRALLADFFVHASTSKFDAPDTESSADDFQLLVNNEYKKLQIEPTKVKIYSGIKDKLAIDRSELPSNEQTQLEGKEYKRWRHAREEIAAQLRKHFIRNPETEQVGRLAGYWAETCIKSSSLTALPRFYRDVYIANFMYGAQFIYLQESLPNAQIDLGNPFDATELYKKGALNIGPIDVPAKRFGFFPSKESVYPIIFAS